MNKEALHSIIVDGQPNISQIVAIKDNESFIDELS